MDNLFREFGVAHSEGSGPRLAATLSPEPTSEEPQKLHRIWKSANFHDVKPVMRRKILDNAPPMGLPNDEIQGWVEVYYCYWRTLGEILAIEQGNSREKVGVAMTRFLRSHSRDDFVCRSL